MNTKDTNRIIARTERKLRALREKYVIECPHCGKSILASAFASVAASRAASMRKRNVAGPGRPKKLAPCDKCGTMLGVVEMRAHRC